MEEKKFKSLKQKGQNRVYGKDWIFSGQSKGFPNTLDIRYEKDLKLQESSKKKKGKTLITKSLPRKVRNIIIPRKPKILD